MGTQSFTNIRPVRIAFGVLFIVVVSIVLRLVWLQSDPPGWLSWSSGVYTDEGYYTLDARHRALFGTLAPGNFHDSYLSPLLSEIQYGWFKLVGVGLIQARLLTVLFSALTLILFWDLLRRRVNLGVANIGTLMLGLSPVYLFYNVLALQETPALFWIVLAVWLMSPLAPNSGEEGPLAPNSGATGLGVTRAFLAGLCVVAAFATKSLSIVVVPLWFPLLSKERVRVRFAFAVGLVLALAVYAIVCRQPHHDEIARMSAYYARVQFVPHRLRFLALNIERALIGGEKGVVPYLIATMPVSVALVIAGFRKSRPLPVDVVPVVWLACGLAFCALSSYAPSRYYVLFLPALCWLAATGWCGLPSATWRRLSIAGIVVVSACWTGASWVGRTDTVVTAEARINRSMNAHPMLIGEFAPELTLATNVDSAPVQPGLSNDVDPVGKLDPYAVTVMRTPYWQRWWRTRYPSMIRPSCYLYTITVGNRRKYLIDLYANPNYHSRPDAH